jgi:aspartyl-tRNA(Asn)/glutamyl-tRNA(Gln) amidotransferase subunit A
MKPTYGKVSRFGLMAMASSLDQIGPFGKTVSDAREIYMAIKGADKMDATSIDVAESRVETADIKSMTVGIPKEFFSGEGMDKDTASAMEETMSILRNTGMKIKEISLPNTKYSLATYYIIMFAEVSTNLARFDGIRYCRKKGEDDNLLEIYTKTRGVGFGDEVKRRVLLGTFVLSSGYYDAYYAKAQKVRRLIQDDFVKAFNDVDVIFSPISPTLPFKFGERTDDPVRMYLSDIFTMPVNLAGLPAISIPVKGREGKLPIGFQLIGKRFEDSNLFSIGEFYEQI